MDNPRAAELVAYVKQNTEGIDEAFIERFTYTLLMDEVNDFCISLREVHKEYLGIERYDNAKHALVMASKEFVVDKHYKIVNVNDANKVELACLRKKGDQEGKSRGRPRDEILLSVETFKKLSMKANNAFGVRVRDYYLQLVRCYQNFILNHNEAIVVEQIDHVANVRVEHVANAFPQIAAAPLEYDLTEYLNTHCVYFLSFTESKFKFGRTGDVKKRIYDHTRDFKSKGLNFTIHRILRCRSEKVSLAAENRIKNFWRRYVISEYGKKEMLSTDEIDTLVDDIEKFISEFTDSVDESSMDKQDHILEKMRIEAEIHMDDNVLKRHELEIKRFELEIKRFEMEINDKQNDRTMQFEMMKLRNKQSNKGSEYVMVPRAAIARGLDMIDVCKDSIKDIPTESGNAM